METPRIDTNLYSRQIGAFGMDAMSRIVQMRIFISGLGGVGAEIAKNLILGGPRRVVLHDDRLTTGEDTGSNFALSQGDVGKPRAEAAREKLAVLNSYVDVQVYRGALTKEILSEFDVVVVTEGRLSERQWMNKVCRSSTPSIGFVDVQAWGLCSYAFVDYGDSFHVYDPTGEEPKQAIIEGITQEERGVVTLHGDKAMPFSRGDFVRFAEVKGMEELNERVFEVQSTSRHSFTIGDTRGMGAYRSDGVVTQVVQGKTLSFRPLEEWIRDPREFSVADLSCPERPGQLFLCWLALSKLREEEGLAWSEPLALATLRGRGAALLAELGAAYRETRPELFANPVEPRFFEQVAALSHASVAPTCTFLGGLAAQEVFKWTGKYQPLMQGFFLDRCQGADEPRDPPAPHAGRYAHNLQIWGEKTQQLLRQSRVLLVGAGALGCEYLKIFSQLGVACGGGAVYVADHDGIEVSNLSRQFLFRSEHVGESKAATAAMMIKFINPDFNVVPMQHRLCEDTENVFDDAFWGRLDLVVNALDSIAARQYVDSRCVFFKKPLLEAGTLGTKGNVQVILPYLTQSYSESSDPPEDTIPLCTLKHFPNAIEHCIHWARDAFQTLFVEMPRDATALIQELASDAPHEKKESAAATKERLQRILTLLTLLENPTPENCVKTAIDLFHKFFHHQIAVLLHNFPPNHVTASGQPFWSGPKRAPEIIDRVDPASQVQVQFVLSAASLLAQVAGQPPIKDAHFVAPLIAAAPAEPFKLCAHQRLDDAADHDPAPDLDEDSETAALRQQVVALAKSLRNPHSIRCLEFEKDNDANQHVQFVWACSSLRAQNYRIKPVDFFRTKLIAGKIIPAVATTTAAVTGMAAFELVKLVQHRHLFTPHNRHDASLLARFRNAFANLAISLWLLSEPLPPHRNVDKDYDPIACGPLKARPPGFTVWDMLECSIPNATVDDLAAWLRQTCNVDINILSVGNVCLYNAYLPPHQKQRLHTPIIQTYAAVAKNPAAEQLPYLVVEASCSDAVDGADVILPPIKLNLK